jgi:hypothetical protein
MILRQEFKTGEGARKRATFENAHSRTHTYTVIRYKDGLIDLAAFDRDSHKDYTWRVQKLKRAKVS